MERQTPSPETNARFYAHKPEYHGVIAHSGRDRFVISSKGTWWMWQKCHETANGPEFGIVTKFKRLSRFGDKLPAALRDALPDGLPDDPRDYARPWAAVLDQVGQRFAAAKYTADCFAGVIAQSKRGRLVFLWAGDRPKYALQVQDGDGWRNAATGYTSDRLLNVLDGLQLTALSRPLAGDAVLWVEVGKLPRHAADFKGRKPEKMRDVQAFYARPGDPERKPARARVEGKRETAPKRRTQHDVWVQAFKAAKGR